MRATDINDLVIPLSVVRQGYRTLLEEGAYCWEEATISRGEFSRQVRITNRTLRALFANRDLMNPLRAGLFSFQLLSHKLIRFLVPFCLVFVAITNVLLVSKGPVYELVLLLQAGFYAVAAIGERRVGGPLARVAVACRTFVVANAAMLGGWITYLQGETFTSWQTVR